MQIVKVRLPALEAIQALYIFKISIDPKKKMDTGSNGNFIVYTQK
jgi:hypothetical protein